jgi:hypothetical protein
LVRAARRNGADGEPVAMLERIPDSACTGSNAVSRKVFR